jgi:hypothetical protein
MKYKKLLWLALFGLGAYGTTKLSLNTTNNFMLSEILSDRPFEPLFATRDLTLKEGTEVEHALSQKYTYFGCGGQAFIFFSEDGNYVIKFFKQRHFREPTHLNYIPFIGKYKERKYYKRRKRLCLDYGSYKIAFEKMPEETEVIYVHLNKTPHWKQKLTVIDKLNIEHQIDLDNTDFILQRKADLVHTRIDKQMAENDLEGARQTIAKVIDLIITRCKKGFRDRDPNIATNCGIYKNHAIKIDVGRFTQDPLYAKPVFYKAELYHLTRPFSLWLSHKYPQLVPILDEEVMKVIVHE